MIMISIFAHFHNDEVQLTMIATHNTHHKEVFYKSSEKELNIRRYTDNKSYKKHLPTI